MQLNKKAVTFIKLFIWLNNIELVLLFTSFYKFSLKHSINYLINLIIRRYQEPLADKLEGYGCVRFKEGYRSGTIG